MGRHAAIQVESVYGTVPTMDSTAQVFELLSETMALTRSHETIGTIREPGIQQINVLTESVGGEIVIAGNYNGIGFLLENLYGSVTTSGAPSLYTHLFPPAAGIALNRTGVSFSMEVSRGDATRTSRYGGCKVTSYGFSASVDQSPQLTFGIMGKNEATGTAIDPSPAGLNMWDDWRPMKVQDITFSLASVSDLIVRSIDLNATYGVDEPHGMGASAFATEPVDNTNFAVEGSAEVIMANTTEYAKYITGTALAIDVGCDDSTHSILHEMDGAVLTAASWNMDGRERVIANYEWQCQWAAVATNVMRTTLVNNVATLPPV